MFTIIDQRKLLLQWKRLQLKYQTVALWRSIGKLKNHFSVSTELGTRHLIRVLRSHGELHWCHNRHGCSLYSSRFKGEGLMVKPKWQIKISTDNQFLMTWIKFRMPSIAKATPNMIKRQSLFMTLSLQSNLVTYLIKFEI